MARLFALDCIGFILVLVAFLTGCHRMDVAEGLPGIQLQSTESRHGAWDTGYISQYGINWVFDQPRTVGTFANGDFWVLGPVTIVRIDPPFDGRHNGWQVNPEYPGAQGFDIRARPFDASLVPRLPYQATGTQSIVKVVGSDTANASAQPVIQRAAVLTVVMSIPPDSGASVFRPPYAGSEKTMYAVSRLHLELLPTLAPVPGAPPLDSVFEWFRRVQLDIKGGLAGEQLRPLDNIRGLGYAPSMAMYSNDAALRLMLSDPIGDKMPALTAFVQKGIDIHYAVLSGQTWPDGGGHQPGHLLPWAFAATMLGDDGMKRTIKAASFLHEDRGTSLSAKTGRGLFGFADSFWTEQSYWQTLKARSPGSTSEKDPYGYIDGGWGPGNNDSYLFCCIAQAWKGSALAFQLMPSLKAAWNNPGFFDFADRWVQHGVLTQPDPCAPAKGTYGTDFGPDGKGDCIKDHDSSDGIGRLPALDGTQPDGGYRDTPFQHAMWKAYRHAAQ